MAEFWPESATRKRPASWSAYTEAGGKKATLTTSLLGDIHGAGVRYTRNRTVPVDPTVDAPALDAPAVNASAISTSAVTIVTPAVADTAIHVATTSTQSIVEVPADQPVQPPIPTTSQKRRGRPPGSKNRIKK